MKILVLGGDGMLGHQLLAEWTGRHDVKVTLRQALSAYRQFPQFVWENSFDEVDARDADRVAAVIWSFRPDAVINGIGIVKQRAEAKVAIDSIEINALLPHQLLEICRENRSRLIHISTDCVFSGRTGGYRENDTPDPVDLYGRSKLLGEIDAAPGLTLRTSIIGLELTRKTGLVEWFLGTHGTVRGFRRAIYTGLTTRALARLIEHVLAERPGLSGLWHVASQPVTKYDLLVRLSAALGRTDVTLVPDDVFACDRSMRGDAFVAETGWRVPAWDEMIDELAAEIRERERGQRISGSAERVE